MTARIKRIWAVTKVMLKTGSQSQTKRRKNGRTKSSAPALIFSGLFLLIVAALFTALYLMQLNFFRMPAAGSVLNDVLLINAFALITIVMAFSVIFIVTFFFLSKDNDVFLPLPITSGEIYLGRMLSALINVYIVEIVFVLPYFIAFDIAFAPHWVTYFNQLILLLINPLIITSLTFLIFLLFARIFNISKHRKVVNGVLLTLSFILSFVGFAVYSMNIQLGLSGSDPSVSVEGALFEYQGLINFLKGASNWLVWYREPFAISMSGGILSGEVWHSVIATLTFLLLGAGLVIASYFIAIRFYTPVLLGSSEGTSRRSKKKLGAELKASKPQNSFQALLSKEFKTVFRSGTNFSQLILPILIMIPILLISFLIPLFIEGDTTISLGEIQAMIQNLPAAGNLLAAFIALAFVAFSSSMVLVSATAISREGANAYLMKIMPVSISKQLLAKMFLGVTFTTFMTLLVEIPLLILLGFDWLFIVLVVISSIITIILINYFMLLIDLKRPMLNWREEIIAVKQNVNTFLGMIVAFVFSIVYVGFGLLFFFVEMPEWVSTTLGILLGLVIPLAALLLTNYLTNKKGYRLLANVE